jgi:hypothetical protein
VTKDNEQASERGDEEEPQEYVKENLAICPTRIVAGL